MTAHRVIALVLVFCMLIPSRAYAIDSLIGYGVDEGMDAIKDWLNGDEQDNTVKSNYAGEYATEAEKLKKRLSEGAIEGQKKRIRLSQAKTLGVAMNDKIEEVDLQIDAKVGKMQSAVRSLREREKSMQTIRWSPLFNFKFPTKPNEAEAFEFAFKPTQLQNEITKLKHKITELTLDTYEKVSNCYVKIITANQEVEVLEDRYKKLNRAVERLEVKLKDGTGTLELAESGVDVEETDAEGNKMVVSPRVLKARVKAAQERYDVAVQRRDNCLTKLTNARTELEEQKFKLSNMIGFDVTKRFTFEDAFVTASLNRDNIEYLYEVAKEDDATVYEAQMTYDEALLTLNTNYSLMKKQYANYISMIEPYIQMSLDGSKVPKKAFKKDYDDFLKAIDEPWKGSYKIWFIKIPKEWLKGEIDGIRFIQDDPYVLYTACLEFEAANKELKNAKSELKNTIYETYGQYAQTRKAYLNANQAYIKAEKMLGISEVRYLLGDLTQEEFENEEAQYEDLKDEAEESLSEFSQTLYSFDRTTCGALSKFLEGAAAEGAGSEAISLTPVIRRGAIYTIRPIIDSEEFLLSIDIPDDFYAETGITITDFELWCDDQQIGKRTPVGENLRHLMLSVRNLAECYIKLYNGTTFVDECLIEPTVFSGPLNIKIGYEDNVNAHTIGRYTTGDDLATDMLQLTLNLDQEQVRLEYESGADAAFYRLCVAQDTYILSDRMIPVDQTFTYLSVLKSDLANVFIELFDADGTKIGDARFDTKTKEIYNDIDEEQAAEIAAKKRKEAEELAEKLEEEERLAAIQQERDDAAAVLRALGITVSDKSITYALEHLNELGYALDLKAASADLKAEHDNAVKNYEAIKDDPSVSEKDKAAAADRVRITSLMPGIYDKTQDEGVKNTLKELENYSGRYKQQLLAEYMVEFRATFDETSTNARKESADKRMKEIEQICSDSGFESPTFIKDDYATFKKNLDKINSFDYDAFFDEKKYKEFAPASEITEDISLKFEESGFGNSYMKELHAAQFKTVDIMNTKLSEIDTFMDFAMKDEDVDVKKEEVKGADVLKARDEIVVMSKHLATYQENFVRLGAGTRDKAYQCRDKIDEMKFTVDRQLKKRIDKYNGLMKTNYDNMKEPTDLKSKVEAAKNNYDIYKKNRQKKANTLKKYLDKYNELKKQLEEYRESMKPLRDDCLFLYDKVGEYEGKAAYTKDEIQKRYEKAIS